MTFIDQKYQKKKKLQEKIQDHLTSLKIKKKHNKRLRSPENIWKLVLTLAERIKKKDGPQKLRQSTREKKAYFNKDDTYNF